MKIDRVKIHNKCSKRCGYCGEKIGIKQMQVDHIIPKHNFISVIKNKECMIGIWIPEWLMHLGLEDINHIDNLMPTCRSCNHYKSSMPLETFRKELSMQIERLNNNVSHYKLARRFGLAIETNIKVKFYFEKIKVGENTAKD